MTSHLGLLVLFSVFVSRDLRGADARRAADQLRFGARLLGGFVGAAISWPG